MLDHLVKISKTENTKFDTEAFFEKAAAIAESIIINHPFVDGNKRTGYLCYAGNFG